MKFLPLLLALGLGASALPEPEQAHRDLQFITNKPTVKPTALPTSKPTVKPTALPTNKPTVKPTMTPTNAPTPFPTKDPLVCDATRAEACKMDPNCKSKPAGAPQGVIEEWTGRGTMNCYELGFDFGWKTGDPGCFNEIQSPFTADEETLMQTKIRDCPDCDGTVPHATYQVNCRGAEGNQFKFADITASTDMYVYAKAQSGYLFEYKAGTQLTVSVGRYI